MKNASYVVMLCLLSAFAFTTTPAYAGWFEVKNYVGTIGKSEIHLSIQTFDYINHEDSGRWRVRGSYYYDKYHTPIPLKGRRNSDGSMLLCEASRFKSFSDVLTLKNNKFDNFNDCPLHIRIKGEKATGTWMGTRKNLKIRLRQVGYLNNTGQVEPMLEGKVNIPMWYYTNTLMFIGVYTSSKECGVGSMTKLLLVKRSNGDLYRTIELGCDYGVVPTVVYSNVFSSGKDGYFTLIATGGYHGMGRDVVKRVIP